MKRLYGFLGMLLIAGGLFLIFIPLYRWLSSSYYQAQALQTLEKSAVVEGEKTESSANKQAVKDDLPKALGLLEIPKINLKVAVVHGTSQEDLNKGAGFYAQSKHPEIGNVSIAAHRGLWFRHLDRLEANDEIILTLGTNRYHYLVREQFITHSRDWSVIDSTGKAELTLTTCLYTTNTKRLIVKADLAKIEILTGTSAKFMP
ncbi:MAG: sortase [Firmicutes bacterium]|nr:sortase [Bacillota bacterium]